MATANPQGIMALPAEGASAQPQLGLDDSYDAVQQGLQNASPDAHSAVNAELTKLAPQLDQLPDEVLDQLLQVIQYMHDNPQEYAKCLKEMIDTGIISEGDFPEEYDPEFLATMGMVIMQSRKTRQGAQQSAPVTPAPMPPAGMARGGIAEAAHMVASSGRGKDSMLAHITPREAQMLRANGGMGTINPATGLPEYGWFSDTLKGIGNAVGGAVKGIGSAIKGIVSSPVGRVLATVALATFLGPGAFGVTGLGLGATASTALASGAITALGGGNMKDVLKSAAIGGATAFFGAPGGAVSNFVGGAVTNAAANAAISSGIVGTGIGLLSGQKLQDAVKSGITAGAISGLTTGATKGFGAQIEAPTVPTVGDMASQPDANAQGSKYDYKYDANGNVVGSTLKPEFSDPMGDFIAERNLDLDPDVVARMGPDQLSNVASTAPQEVFMHDGVPKYAIKDANGNITGFKTVPLADRVYSANGTVSARPADASGVSSSYTGRTSTGPAYDTGFGPGPADVVGGSGTVGGPFDGGVTPVDTSMMAGPAGDGSYKPPTFGRAADEFGRGEYANAAKTVFMPEAPTAEQVHSSEAFQNARAAGADYATAYQKASDTMGSPGLIRTYGPATAAGLGIAGLAGAFTPKPPEPTQNQSDMSARLAAEKARVAANPGAYAPQGLERFGITYNDRGEITGSQPWNPSPMGPTEVAGNYMPYTPSPYMSPTGAIGNPLVARPYNTASMYDFMPRYAADGGIMSSYSPTSPMMQQGMNAGIASLARGGYPRRTGQISGPGTPTSDDIPAMLSDGEFVFTEKAVRGMGNGNRRAGAKKMYALMHQLERNAARG